MLHAVCLWSQRHHAVFCETALRKEGRWGCFHSRSEIRSPSPRGLIPDRYSARGVHHLTRFPVRNSPKILFPPRARLSGLSPGTARPLSQGAGGGRGSGRAAGVSHEYRLTRDTVPREETTTSRSHLILPENPVSVPRARLSGAIAMHCPPPLAGGGRRPR